MKFASGDYAWGRCQRCGDKRKLLDLREDKHTKGLMVCDPCFDIEHPTRKPFNPEDATALRKPSPDTDDDSGGSAVDITGTAQAGGSMTITLASSDTVSSNGYINSTITLTGGTGSGQTKTIQAYNSITKVATVDSPWSVTPNATTTYSIVVGLLGVGMGFTNFFGTGT